MFLLFEHMGRRVTSVSITQAFAEYLGFDLLEKTPFLVWVRLTFTVLSAEGHYLAESVRVNPVQVE